jgi:hypothetical protein
MSLLEKLKFGKSNRRLSFMLVFFLCITCVTLVVVNSYLENKTTSKIEKPIIEIKETPVEEVTPSEQTEFFSKETGKALLYYAMVNDSITFYKTKGKHPITGEDLLLVTEAIIDSYKKRYVAVVEKPVKKKPFKNVKGEIITKRKKPKVKKKKTRGSIWNTTLENSNQRDEVSLFVFDAGNKIDLTLTERFKEEFEKKKYYITGEVIYYDVMTSEIATNLQNKNIDYFQGNLVKHTDYICYAKATYEYSQNILRDDFLDCTMKIDYVIYSSETGEVLLSEKDKVIGAGQNKKNAKLKAIEKFVL